MNIQNKEDKNEGSFYVEEDGEQVAELVYRKEKGRMVIEHTEVDEALRGKSVGFELVEKAVEYARQEHLKIIPLCEFADKVIQEHKEFQDVL